MRKVSAIVVVAFVCSSVKAQKLIVLPEFSMQTYRSEISNTNLFHKYGSYSNLSPAFNFKLLYQSKKGHGPYAAFRFGDMNISSIDSSGFRSAGVAIRQYELGYHWISKPVYFKRLWNNNISREDFESSPQKGWAVQFMPSAGLIYTRGVPGSSSSSFGTTSIHELRNRSNFGISTGLGMAFSKNGRQLFTLSVNYTKNFGELYSSSFQKPGSTSFQSTKGSGWGISLGVPILSFPIKKK